MAGINAPGYVNTVFGPVLCGAQPAKGRGRVQVTAAIPEDIDFLWKQDQAGIDDDQTTCEDREAEDFMKNHLQYDEEEQHYKTALPWKKDPATVLGSNRERAKAVAKATFRRTAKHRHLVEEAFQKMEDQDFAEEVPPGEVDCSSFCYYLEVHCVLRLERESSRCRVVMNAAARDPDSGATLNDCLLTGPNLLSEIPSILLRFRREKYALAFDVSQMFHQVKLMQDKDALRFFAPPREKGGPLRHMRHKSLPFGLTSSPFQALFVLRTHLNRTAEKSPHTKPQVELIQKNLYMDDCIISMSTEDDLAGLLDTVKTSFQTCGMKIHKVGSNRADLLKKNLQPEDLLTKKATSVLGIDWKMEEDSIGLLSPAPKKKESLTKRAILADVARIFDILGTIAPYTVRAKLILQLVWEEKKDWDEELSPELSTRFMEWKKEAPLIPLMTMPRWIQWERGDQLYLAAFGDSSLLCYGAVVYAVVRKPDGTMISTFLIAKTRVAPRSLMKTKKMSCEQLSICRLELLGQLLSTKLAETAREALNLPHQNVLLFSDSTVTLGRLRQGHHRYTLYVGNRVKQCLQHFPAEQYRYVNTKHNPADIASRGETLEALKKSTLWWHGPAFLQRPVEEWGSAMPNLTAEEEEADKKEHKKTVETCALVTPCLPEGLSELRQRTNDWGKLTRVTAYVLRFISAARRQTRSGRELCDVSEVPPLTFKEISAAEVVWIKILQAEAFPEEIRACEQEEPVKTKLRELMPFLADGLLLHHSRVRDNPHMRADPIILPKHHQLSEALVLYYHRLLLHGPPETTYTFLRRRFVLCGGRREMKRILHLCKNNRCRPFRQVKSQLSTLPSFRVDYTPPMLTVSLDPCGPFLVRHGCSFNNCPHPDYSKAWALVLTCNSTRFIHVEGLPDLTADSIMEALERFFARRGIPSLIISDQGKQLVAASKELKSIWQHVDLKKLQEKTAPRGVTWQFNTCVLTLRERARRISGEDSEGGPLQGV